MRLSLHCHPLISTSAVDEFWVTYSWLSGGILKISYHLEGAIDCLSLPPVTEPERADGLWENTCFELFLREASANGYCEFNFSPSGRWAAYQFLDYRENMVNLELPNPPDIVLDSSTSHIVMEVILDLSNIAHQTSLNAGFSAVIADKDGCKSYWALSHPPEKPDFHHKDGFSHQLKAADSL